MSFDKLDFDPPKACSLASGATASASGIFFLYAIPKESISFPNAIDDFIVSSKCNSLSIW